jgi:hypothetical protein
MAENAPAWPMFELLAGSGFIAKFCYQIIAC